MFTEMETKDNTQSGIVRLVKVITGYREFGMLIAFAVLLIIAAIITPSMYSLNSLLAMLRNYSIYGIMAAGMMGVIITGGIDLSVGSTLAFSGAVAALMIIAGFPVAVCILAAVLIGCLCGAVNGMLIGKFKMLPMMATLSTMYIYRGVAYLVSGGAWMMPHQFPEAYTKVAGGQILGIFNILWILALVFVAAHIFYSKTRPGRRIYAVGSSPESAAIVGLKNDWILLIAYTIMGALAGLTGFLYTANYAVWEPAVGGGMEMDVIAICILGGVSIRGGVGKIGGLTVAMLMMSVMSYFLSMIPGMSVWKMAIQGGIIIIAVAVNIFTGTLSEKRILRAREL